MQLNERELATVLAALRHFQGEVCRAGILKDLEEHFIDSKGKEMEFDDLPTFIDDLCERLNCEDYDTSDHDTLLSIQEMMNGVEWNVEMLDEIAGLLDTAGYHIGEPGEVEND